MKVLASIAQDQDAVSKAYVDALFSGYIANKANQLATARSIWGQSFDGTEDITGVASFDKGIEIQAGQSIAFIDSNGVKRYITLDEENGAIKIEGNFYSTGESAAGNAGEQAGTSASAVPNINVNVAALHLYNGRSINADDMEALTGLSVEIAEQMLQGAYNKVIDNTEEYPSVWTYTARRTAATTTVYFLQGDGYDVHDGYSLSYTYGSASWSVTIGEI